VNESALETKSIFKKFNALSVFFFDALGRPMPRGTGGSNFLNDFNSFRLHQRRVQLPLVQIFKYRTNDLLWDQDDKSVLRRFKQRINVFYCCQLS
jgi:hypothetical protein